MPLHQTRRFFSCSLLNLPGLAEALIGHAHMIQPCRVPRCRYTAVSTRATTLARTNKHLRDLSDGIKSSALVERENLVPVVFHADHGPTVLLRFFVQCRRESPDLAVGQTLGRPISVFARRIVVKEEHLQPRTGSGTRPLQH